MPASNSESRKRHEENPNQSNMASCGHRHWRDGRCAEMTCSNYINKHSEGIHHLPHVDDAVESP